MYEYELSCTLISSFLFSSLESHCVAKYSKISLVMEDGGGRASASTGVTIVRRNCMMQFFPAIVYFLCLDEELADDSN